MSVTQMAKSEVVVDSFPPSQDSTHTGLDHGQAS